MAQIDLLPRKEFKIILDDGTTISGKFGTWALKRFCQKRNISLNDADTKLSNIQIDDAIDYILCAVEQSFRETKSKDGFLYNDVDVCLWCDQLGGISGGEFSRLFNHAGEQATEKKNEPANP